MNNRIQTSTLAAAAVAALLATACGGGGDGASSGSADLTIAGTAATGAALASAAVDVKCASGNGSATTGADGHFSIVIAGGASPCALRVANGAAFLHSLVAAGSGASATANITPLSELLAGRVAGGAPDDLFTTFDAAAQGKVSADAVTAAKADLVAGLKSHVDLTGLDPLTDALAVGGTLDQKLDALAAVLAAAGITLDDLRNVLIANPGSPAPIEHVLQPPAASCIGLRSGRYRAINPLETDPAFRAQVIEIDAATLKVAESDGTVTTFTDTGNCTFGTPEGTLLVSRSGFGVFHSTAAPSQAAVLIPEQAIGLPELAGTWNYVSYHRPDTGQPFAPTNGYLTLDAAGKLSAFFDCVGRDACTDVGPTTDLTVNTADGGFDRVTAAGVRRTFAYKTASGGITSVTLFPGQLGLTILTKQVARVLPAVNDTTRSFDVNLNSSGIASAIAGAGITRTVTAVDATTQSYSRVWSSDGRVDGFSINNPRTGMFYRPASVSPINGGGTVNISELLLLPLPGGASVYSSVNPAENFLGLSVNY